MTITLYGIPNCNTVKKARDWLENQGVAYDFHDFKKHGVPDKPLQNWVDVFGWEKVMNRAGMTWRRLPDAEKARIADADAAMALMKEKPSIIKRPILDYETGLLRGFNEAEYIQAFTKAA
jgi:Spx/MgsR family transcriptional regulator